jgi:hypothetical protein
MEGSIIFGESVNPQHISSRPLIATVYGNVPSENSDLSRRLRDIVAFRLIWDGKLYLYSPFSGKGTLYDVSKDSSEGQVLTEEKSVRECHEVLYRELERKRVHIRENPL